MTDHLHYSVGRLPAVATPHDYYYSLALAVRDRTQHRWMDPTQTCFDLNRKIACYFSAEFLMGPHLGNNLVNLGPEQAARTAMTELGHDLDVIMSCEEEPGLGNGGLGRLAACYPDYADYITCQEKVNVAWKDSEHWSRMSILNTARSGKFSSDRAISEYCDTIWDVPPVTIHLD